MIKSISVAAVLFAVIALADPVSAQEAGWFLHQELKSQAVEEPAAEQQPHAITEPTAQTPSPRRKQQTGGNLNRSHESPRDGTALHDQIARHAQENGVPYGLANAIVRIESRYNARVVHAGNYGLMQIRAQTARGVGFNGPASALLNPETNLHFGMKYLALAYKQGGGDVCRTVMRYQSGIASTHMSAANRVYCAKAKQIMASR